jgi:hypothetical protein
MPNSGAMLDVTSVRAPASFEAHAGLRRAEEADRMGRHVGQVEPDSVLAAEPGAQQRRAELPDPLTEVGIGDDAVAELEGGTGCE